MDSGQESNGGSVMGVRSRADMGGERSRSFENDRDAVMQFAEAMMARLSRAAQEEGKGDWQDKSKCSRSDLVGMLAESLARPGPNLVSIANYLMMLWVRNETFSQPELASVSYRTVLGTGLKLAAQTRGANEVQVGGEHYKQYGDIQPWDVFMRWNLNPYCAYMLPYLVRYREKGGIEDLKKARHTLDKWIEEEERIAEEGGANAGP